MLAPDPKNAIDQTTNIVNSNATISAWVLALATAALPPLTPVPAWYANIETTLSAEQKKLSSYWIKTGPANFATLTQSLINFANTFLTQADVTTKLVGDITAAGGTPSPQQLQQLTALSQRLLDRASAAQSAVATAEASMSATHGDLVAAKTALATAVQAAQQAETADYATIQQIRQQISAIQQKIAAESAQMNDQQMSAGTTMAGIIGAFTIGLVASGGVLALGGFAIAILSIGAAATQSEIFSNDVQNDYKQVETLASTLSAANVQLAMVQGVLGTLDQLVNQNATALQSFSAFTDIWDEMVLRLQYLMVVLDQPQIDVRRVPDLNDLGQAAAAWQRISDFATKAQLVPFTTGTLTLPPIIATSPALHVV